MPHTASCADLPLTCGPNANASCCDSKTIPGGMVYREYDGVNYLDKSHPARVSTFRLDTYEVTVGRFRQFVSAGFGTRAKPPATGAGARTLNGSSSQAGWDPAWTTALLADQAALIAALDCNTFATWTDKPANHENLPITCITWYEAQAYCIWDGGFLPTITESMYAMGGGSLQRVYPWSTPPTSTKVDCTQTNYGGTKWPSTACNADGAMRVGSKSPAGDGAFGQADLGGNAFEWALDWATVTYLDPCNDCADLTQGQANSRVLRGGSFESNEGELRGAGSFNGLPPKSRASWVGARCARY